MALKIGDVRNFETLRRAELGRMLCLLETTDKATGQYVALVCAMNIVWNPESGENEYQPVPLAEMIKGNPYKLYNDPFDPPINCVDGEWVYESDRKLLEDLGALDADNPSQSDDSVSGT